MQNITLVKEQTTNTQRISVEQLKITLKQKSIISNQLHNQIQRHRNQIKSLSDSVSKFIQKKLKPTQLKQRPKLNKQYNSPKLNHYQQQKNKIYRQILQTKELIKQIKSQEEPQKKLEFEKKSNFIKDLQSKIEQNQQNKKYLIHQLNQNKSKIFQLNDNQNLKNTNYNEKLLQQIKKEFKIHDKKAYYLNNQEIIQNLYYFQIKNSIQRTTTQSKEVKDVDYKLINLKIVEINQILQERNHVQKQSLQKINQLQTKISEFFQANRTYQLQIRHLQKDRLQKNMEHRGYKSINSKSTSQINKIRVQKNYSSIKQSHKNLPNQQKILNRSKINQFVTQVQDMEQNQQIIQIGDIQLTVDSAIRKDQFFNEDAKIYRLIFLYNKKNIVGIKASYSTKKGKKQGNMNSITHLQKFTQVDINLNDVDSIIYPKNNKNMFIRFHKRNYTIDQFGLQYLDQPLKVVSLSNKHLKSIEIIIQNKTQNSKIKGIRLIIKKNNNDYVNLIDEQIFQKGSQQTKAKSVVDLHHSKVSSNNNPLNRKLVLGGLKKINQPKMDHRLLIGRKKLV